MASTPGSDSKMHYFLVFAGFPLPLGLVAGGFGSGVAFLSAMRILLELSKVRVPFSE